MRRFWDGNFSFREGNTFAKIDYNGVKKLVLTFLLNNVVAFEVIVHKSTPMNVV